MKKIINIILIFVFSLLLSSCTLRYDDPVDNNGTDDNEEPIEKPNDNTNDENTNDVKPNNGLPSLGLLTLKEDVICDNVSTHDLFDINNIIDININISNEELEKIENDYKLYSSKGLKSPIYRKCESITINIIKNGKSNVFTFYDVGIRMKGNTSRKSFYENDNIKDIIHFKISFEETFDSSYYNSNEKTDWTLYESSQRQSRKNRTFLGLEKLDLRYNKVKDKSYIKEYYASMMYNDFGIITPKMNFSSLSLTHSGKTLNYGIYLVTEPLDDILIKNVLNDNSNYINLPSLNEELNGTYGTLNKIGQLYKASYSSGRADMTKVDDILFGVETDTFTPSYELKTNKKTNDNTLIKNMISILNNSDLNEINKVVDLEYFAMYEAVATVLSDPDSLRNNYNNYAMYFRKTDGKMIIIPIDLDRSLGIGNEYDPFGDCNTTISPFSDITSNKEKQVNNLYLKTILKDTYVRDLYIDNLNKVLDSKWCDINYFNSIYNKVKSNYSDFEKTCFYKVGFSNEERYKENSNNMSFSDFINRRKEVITSSIEALNNNGVLQGATNFYLTGIFDNWNKTTEEYKFNKTSTNTYEYYYKVTSDRLEFKVYNSDKSMWLRSENNEVLHEGGANMVITNLKVNSYIHFTIDTSSGILSWEILDNIN